MKQIEIDIIIKDEEPRILKCEADSETRVLPRYKIPEALEKIAQKMEGGEGELLRHQVDRLALFILSAMPEFVIQNEGACDVAIKALQSLQKERDQLLEAAKMDREEIKGLKAVLEQKQFSLEDPGKEVAAQIAAEIDSEILRNVINLYDEDEDDDDDDDEEEKSDLYGKVLLEPDDKNKFFVIGQKTSGMEKPVYIVNYEIGSLRDEKEIGKYVYSLGEVLEDIKKKANMDCVFFIRPVRNGFPSVTFNNFPY